MDVSRQHLAGALLVGLSAAGPAWAEAPCPFVVRDARTGQPVPRARVVVDGRGIPVDARGHGAVDVAGDPVALTVTSPDHEPITVHIASCDEPPIPVELPPILVVVVEDAERPDGAQVDVRTQEELASVPGAFGDPVRALATSPSVAPVSAGQPGIVVRGAEPTHTAVRIDGIDVPWLYHWYFLRSVVDPARLDRTKLHVGGAPAAEGGFVQGLLDVETIATAGAPGFHGRAHLDLFDLGVSGTAAVGDWTLLGSGRLSGGGELYGLAFLLASGGSAYLPLRFSDYHLRATREFDAARLSVTALGAADAMRMFARDDVTVPEEGDLPYDPTRLLDRQFHRLSVDYVRRTHWGRLESRLTGGLDASRSLFQDATPALASAPGPLFGSLRGWRLDGTTRLRIGLGRRWDLDAGVDGDLQRTLGQHYGLPDDPSALWLGSAAAWTAFEHHGEGVWTSLGLRGTVHVLGGAQSWLPEPRLLVRARLAERWDGSGYLVGTSQRPVSWQLLDAFGNPDLNPERSWQAGLGATFEPSPAWAVSLRGYASLFPNVAGNVPSVSLERRIGLNGEAYYTADRGPAWRDVRGTAAGLELQVDLTPPDEPARLGMALTAQSSRRISGSHAFPSDSAELVRASVWGAWEPGPRWQLSGRLLLGSGLPATSMTSVFDPRADDVYGLPGPVNGIRSPSRHRLDLRVARTFEARRADWTLYLDVFNATARPIPVVSRFDPVEGAVVPVMSLPVIPNLGVEVAF